MTLIKTLALSGAAVAALGVNAFAADLNGQPIAASSWDAFVSAGAGHTWYDSSGIGDFFDDLDDFNAEIRATAAYQFQGGFGLQSDLVFNYQSLDVPNAPSDLDFNVKNFDVAFHAFYRNDNWLIGAFGQYGFSSPEPIGSDFDRFYAGAEAQYYFERATIYVQGGWQGVDTPENFGPGEADIDGFFINAELRYFVGDNLKLAVNGGFDRLTTEVGTLLDTDADTFKVGGTIEYRFDATPLSMFLNAEYRNTEFDRVEGETPEVEETRILAGIKLNLGTQTLIERDRSGATLDYVRPGSLGMGGAFDGAFEN